MKTIFKKNQSSWIRKAIALFVAVCFIFTNLPAVQAGLPANSAYALQNPIVSEGDNKDQLENMQLVIPIGMIKGLLSDPQKYGYENQSRLIEDLVAGKLSGPLTQSIQTDLKNKNVSVSRDGDRLVIVMKDATGVNILAQDTIPLTSTQAPAQAAVEVARIEAPESPVVDKIKKATLKGYNKLNVLIAGLESDDIKDKVVQEALVDRFIKLFEGDRDERPDGFYVMDWKVTDSLVDFLTIIVAQAQRKSDVISDYKTGWLGDERKNYVQLLNFSGQIKNKWGQGIFEVNPAGSKVVLYDERIITPTVKAINREVLLALLDGIVRGLPLENLELAVTAQAPAAVKADTSSDQVKASEPAQTRMADQLISEASELYKEFSQSEDQTSTESRDKLKLAEAKVMEALAEFIKDPASVPDLTVAVNIMRDAYDRKLLTFRRYNYIPMRGGQDKNLGRTLTRDGYSRLINILTEYIDKNDSAGLLDKLKKENFVCFYDEFSIAFGKERAKVQAKTQPAPKEITAEYLREMMNMLNGSDIKRNEAVSALLGLFRKTAPINTTLLNNYTRELADLLDKNYNGLAIQHDATVVLMMLLKNYKDNVSETILTDIKNKLEVLSEMGYDYAIRAKAQVTQALTEVATAQAPAAVKVDTSGTMRRIAVAKDVTPEEVDFSSRQDEFMGKKTGFRKKSNIDDELSDKEDEILSGKETNKYRKDIRNQMRDSIRQVRDVLMDYNTIIVEADLGITAAYHFSKDGKFYIVLNNKFDSDVHVEAIFQEIRERFREEKLREDFMEKLMKDEGISIEEAQKREFQINETQKREIHIAAWTEQVAVFAKSNAVPFLNGWFGPKQVPIGLTPYQAQQISSTGLNEEDLGKLIKNLNALITEKKRSFFGLSEGERGYHKGVRIKYFGADSPLVTLAQQNEEAFIDVAKKNLVIAKERLEIIKRDKEKAAKVQAAAQVTPRVVQATPTQTPAAQRMTKAAPKAQAAVSDATSIGRFHIVGSITLANDDMREDYVMYEDYKFSDLSARDKEIARRLFYEKDAVENVERLKSASDIEKITKVLEGLKDKRDWLGRTKDISEWKAKDVIEMVESELPRVSKALEIATNATNMSTFYDIGLKLQENLWRKNYATYADIQSGLDKRNLSPRDIEIVKRLFYDKDGNLLDEASIKAFTEAITGLMGTLSMRGTGFLGLYQKQDISGLTANDLVSAIEKKSKKTAKPIETAKAQPPATPAVEKAAPVTVKKVYSSPESNHEDFEKMAIAEGQKKSIYMYNDSTKKVELEEVAILIEADLADNEAHHFTVEEGDLKGKVIIVINNNLKIAPRLSKEEQESIQNEITLSQEWEVAWDKFLDNRGEFIFGSGNLRDRSRMLAQSDVIQFAPKDKVTGLTPYQKCKILNMNYDELDSLEKGITSQKQKEREEKLSEDIKSFLEALGNKDEEVSKKLATIMTLVRENQETFLKAVDIRKRLLGASLTYGNLCEILRKAGPAIKVIEIQDGKEVLVDISVEDIITQIQNILLSNEGKSFEGITEAKGSVLEGLGQIVEQAFRSEYARKRAMEEIDKRQAAAAKETAIDPSRTEPLNGNRPFTLADTEKPAVKEPINYGHLRAYVWKDGEAAKFWSVVGMILATKKYSSYEEVSKPGGYFDDRELSIRDREILTTLLYNNGEQRLDRNIIQRISEVFRVDLHGGDQERMIDGIMTREFTVDITKWTAKQVIDEVDVWLQNHQAASTGYGVIAARDSRGAEGGALRDIVGVTHAQAKITDIEARTAIRAHGWSEDESGFRIVRFPKGSGIAGIFNEKGIKGAYNWTGILGNTTTNTYLFLEDGLSGDEAAFRIDHEKREPDLIKWLNSWEGQGFIQRLSPEIVREFTVNGKFDIERAAHFLAWQGQIINADQGSEKVMAAFMAEQLTNATPQQLDGIINDKRQAQHALAQAYFGRNNSQVGEAAIDKITKFEGSVKGQAERERAAKLSAQAPAQEAATAQAQTQASETAVPELGESITGALEVVKKHHGMGSYFNIEPVWSKDGKKATIRVGADSADYFMVTISVVMVNGKPTLELLLSRSYPAGPDLSVERRLYCATPEGLKKALEQELPYLGWMPGERVAPTSELGKNVLKNKMQELINDSNDLMRRLLYKVATDYSNGNLSGDDAWVKFVEDFINPGIKLNNLQEMINYICGLNNGPSIYNELKQVYDMRESVLIEVPSLMRTLLKTQIPMSGVGQVVMANEPAATAQAPAVEAAKAEIEPLRPATMQELDPVLRNLNSFVGNETITAGLASVINENNPLTIAYEAGALIKEEGGYFTLTSVGFVEAVRALMAFVNGMDESLKKNINVMVLNFDNPLLTVAKITECLEKAGLSPEEIAFLSPNDMFANYSDVSSKLRNKGTVCAAVTEDKIAGFRNQLNLGENLKLVQVSLPAKDDEAISAAGVLATPFIAAMVNNAIDDLLGLFPAEDRDALRKIIESGDMAKGIIFILKTLIIEKETDLFKQWQQLQEAAKIFA